MPEFGRTLIVIGLFIVLAGIILFLFGDKLGWLGRLPGDIRIEGERTRFYFPIVTMIIISIVLTVVINLIRKIF